MRVRTTGDQFAWIGLGSNLGDSRRILAEAVAWLAAWSGMPLLRSSLWRSSPVDCPPGSSDFVNAVVGIGPRLDETPESLLEKLLNLERVFGRRPKQQANEPRPLDLDLLMFGPQIRRTASLVLPHPRAHLRRFVLAPWQELAPGLLIPGQRFGVGQLLAQLPAGQGVTRLGVW